MLEDTNSLDAAHINQIKMIRYRVVRYIFNDYNLRRNRQADESQSDTRKRRIADTSSLTSLQN